MIMKTMKYIMCAIMALAAMTGLQSCVDVNKVTTKASELVVAKDYEKAISVILKVDDGEILKSDTLLQLLSTAYYGLQLKPTEGVAIECVDMDFTPDGKEVVFTDMHNAKLNVYSFPEMRKVRSIALPVEPFGIDFAPGGARFAAAMDDGAVLICDYASGQKEKTLQGHTSRARSVVFKDTTTLYSCGNDKRIISWNVENGTQNWQKKMHYMNIKSIKLSESKTKLITASNDGSSNIIDVTGDKEDGEFSHMNHSYGKQYVNDAAISADESIAVTVSGDKTVMIWDVKGDTLAYHISLNDPLTAVDISDDGKYILVGGSRNAYVIDSATGCVVTKIPGTNMAIWTVKFIDDKHFAYVDNYRFYYGEFYAREKLIEAARKLGIEDKAQTPK